MFPRTELLFQDWKDHCPPPALPALPYIRRIYTRGILNLSLCRSRLRQRDAVELCGGVELGELCGGVKLGESLVSPLGISPRKFATQKTGLP